MSKVKKNYWLVFVIVHVIFMGVWGAFIEIPEKNGFPATLGYVVWSLTMIPAAIVALKFNNWKIDFSKKAMGLGLLTGLLGAAGQWILFFTLRLVPAYLVFPVISLTPVVTVMLAALVLKERTRTMGWIGIGVAILAIFFLSYTPAGSGNSVGSVQPEAGSRDSRRNHQQPGQTVSFPARSPLNGTVKRDGGRACGRTALSIVSRSSRFPGRRSFNASAPSFPPSSPR